MRRIRYHSYGSPEVLALEEAPVPDPKAGQVLLRAEAIGANFVDTQLRRGMAQTELYPRPLPRSLTGDVVGTVEAVGPDTDPGLIGRRVAAASEDAFCDLIVADARWLVPVPDGLDAGTASALPVAAPVALGVLRAGRLAHGETVLVHSAAGAIGHLAVQLAKILGAGTVIATASTTAKLDFVRAQGADVGVNYTDEDWPEKVRLAAPGGVDVVLDAAGGEVLRRSLDVLAPYGRLVAYGAASGELGSIPVTDLFALRSVTGFSLIAAQAADPERAVKGLAELTEYATQRLLRTAVHARLPLTETSEVHRLLESRAQLGRILAVP
ncbi:oxidoreductase [Streptomyces platensis]|uniref:Oxidoreductase n=1 Tax=Streptomyces platensis TaxID=58346 RepID=A0AAE6NEG9_STRPT|nr:zinc-binding dehydrogenase [Streptomyces platensis]OSY41634.1 Quinone oxidoreductase 1 [Streptomyces platensis]QEV50468.1 oxidoreductase [Streptomyces platensis]